MENKREVLGIVVVTYKTPINLKMCLISIGHYVDDYDLIIVDNGGDEQSKAAIWDCLHKRKVLYEKNIGFCKAVNKAVKQLQTEFFAVVPADCIVTLNWKVKLMNAIKTLPKAGIVATMATQTSGAQGIENNKMIQHPMECQRIILNGAVMKTETFKSLGGLDELFPNKGGNFADDDLGRRYYIAGYRNYIIPDLIFHTRSASYLGDLEAYKADLFQGRDYFTKKWFKT